VRDEQLDVLGGQQLRSNSFMAALKSAVCNDAAKEAKSNTRPQKRHRRRAQQEGTAGGSAAVECAIPHACVRTLPD
jgi:hypothetical protein